MFNVSVLVSGARWAETYAAIEESVKLAVENEAKDVRDSAAGQVAIDTGSAQAGFYVCTQEDDGYSEALNDAQALNPTMPIADHCEQPDGPTTAIVSNAAGHLWFLEWGTIHMAAQPSLTPAAEEELVDFPEAIADAIRKAVIAVLGPTL